MTIREHKLRKRVVFSLDMVSFRMDFYLQYHRRVHFQIFCTKLYFMDMFFIIPPNNYARKIALSLLHTTILFIFAREL